ncbi:MAG: energy transducer TonB [Gemmatimonadaceae bacterium]|nr:energy transducer TonB [Gemmatimonadaceae bacterium]NUQ92774.1 energy transducer TonB [Gemmatimonadaceae bacterium]NUR19161.1 energy transducer TonB [Gemmatimonadaceae bacterium]
MFDNLIETKKKKQRSFGGTILSVIVHVALIAGAVYATAQAREAVLEKPKAEKVDFVEVKKEEPKQEPEKAPPPPDVTVAPPPPKGFQVLAAPVNIPNVIPDIDLSKKVTDEADFTGKGVAGGSGRGVEGGTGPVNNEGAYFEFQVEKTVLGSPENPRPTYPSMLQSAGVEGKVLVQFVVDTSGRADMSTFKILESSHELFSQAVKQALPRYRFFPAEIGGKKVRQVVQLPFSFGIGK